MNCRNWCDGLKLGSSKAEKPPATSCLFNPQVVHIMEKLKSKSNRMRLILGALNQPPVARAPAVGSHSHTGSHTGPRGQLLNLGEHDHFVLNAPKMEERR